MQGGLHGAVRTPQMGSWSVMMQQWIDGAGGAKRRRVRGVDRDQPLQSGFGGIRNPPEAVLDGVMTLQKMIKDRTPRPWKDNWTSPYLSSASTNQIVGG